MHYLLVFLGGGAGSLCRLAIQEGLQRYQLVFPWATLLANGLSCVVFGVVAIAVARQHLPPDYRWLLLTGFCGGFSTFSTFTNETWLLWQNGQLPAALANILLNLGVCLLGLYLGTKWGDWVIGT